MSTRVQLLKRQASSASPSQIEAAADDLVAHTRSLTEILDGLLIAADPRTAAKPTLVDLVAVADEAVALLHEEAVSRYVALTRSGSSVPVVVSGSRAALLHVVVALTTNAIDYAHTSVVVSVTATETNAVVRVIDDGPGFAAGTIDTAFERFASGRNARTTADSTGTPHYGLGLAIVAEISRRHQGSVTIDTSHHTGAAVETVIPLA